MTDPQQPPVDVAAVRAPAWRVNSSAVFIETPAANIQAVTNSPATAQRVCDLHNAEVATLVSLVEANQARSACALDQQQREIERLTAINSKLCSNHNELLIDGTKWQHRAERAQADLAAAQAALAVYRSRWADVENLDPPLADSLAALHPLETP